MLSVKQEHNCTAPLWRNKADIAAFRMVGVLPFGKKLLHS